ncbi:uncharacterized mitochondrial protein AtMg00550, partial [Telopea speciosissima]|uniref:uncharacterized mitochondrial protein AtMg00550 n=1 Tax=Telopea speciosissima TaxID=54955 RepID=UPI001CC4E593
LLHRFLHGVAYGHSWFGRWVYKFHRGCFGEQLKIIIRKFRDASETKLITLRDLLRFMLTCRAPVQRKVIKSTSKRKSPPNLDKSVKVRKLSPFVANTESSRWAPRR